MAFQRKSQKIPWYLILIIFFLAIGIAAIGSLYSENQHIFLITVVVCILVIAAGVTTVLYWGQQRAGFNHRQYKGEGEQETLIQRLDYLTKYAHDIILLVDQDFKIVDANDRAVTSYGYTREELLAMSASDLRTPEARLSLDADLRKVKELNGFVFETIHQRKDGTTFPVEISSRIIEGEGKRFYQSIIRDITERKQAEQALQESEERFRSLAQSASDAILITDSNGKIVFWNEVARKMFGYSPDEVIGKPFSILLPEQSREFHQNILKEIVASGGVGIIGKTLELNVMRKDGSEFPVEGTTSSWKTKGGLFFTVIYRDITERKQTEEALRDSEERFRSVVQNASDAISIIDSNGKIVFWNQVAGKLFGYSAEEVIGKPFSIILSEQAREFHHQNILKEIVASGGAGIIGKAYESNVVRKDGTEFPVESTMASWQTKGGVFFTVIYRDISERKQAEEALRDSEERFRSLAEAASDAIISADINADIIFWNRAAETIFGYSAEEVIGKPVTLIMPERFKESHHSALKQMVSTGTLSTNIGKAFEVTGLRKDGSEIPLEFSFAPWEAKGKTFFTAIARDITERKQVEEALRDSEERFRSLAQTASDAIISIDPQGKIIFWNKAAETIFGYSTDEILGKPIELLLPEQRREKDQNEMKKAISTGISYVIGRPVEGVGLRKDGREFPTETSIAIRETKEGITATGIVRDISERKKIEEELLKVEKIDSLGILAGGIAHDFNNILTAILGNISLARMNVNNTEKSIEKLIEAEKACLRAKDLTQQLLTFSKGGAPIKKVAPISELLRESALFALRGSNCQCEFSIPSNLLPVEMDEGQISQVVNNIVINAQQAMPEGGIIKVGAENFEIGAVRAQYVMPLPEGKYVKVSIKDQGIGIPKEYLKKVFDPYFTTKQKGSGLGLSTCYSIIKNHSGYITAESKMGTGATFTFYLPASQKEVPTRIAIEGVLTPGKGDILVVDDEEMLRDVASSMLTSLGYKVEVVKDGAEALELYKKAKEEGHPFDAVIMDLTIPAGMGGKEAIEKLIEIDPEVKAIVSSGYSNDPIMANYREHGFRGVIAKPYMIEEMSTILYEVIHGIE